MIFGTVLLVALVAIFWMVIALQMRLKFARDNLLSLQHRVQDLEQATPRASPADVEAAGGAR